MSIILREPVTGELPVLKEIWCEVFGAEGMDAFFRCLYSPRYTVIAEHNGKPAAMGYLIPAGELVYADLCEGTFPSAMIYAVAVLPEMRGMGMGADVSSTLITKAFDSGFSAVVTCPSDDSLFDFYGRHAKMRDFFYADIKRISACSTQNSAACNGKSMYPNREHAEKSAELQIRQIRQIRKISVDEYAALRESLLCGITHIKHDIACLEYQKQLCGELGGGFYQIGDSCAVIELQSSGLVCVKELLLANGDDEQDAAAAICGEFPSMSYEYRLLGKPDESSRFGMLAFAQSPPLSSDGQSAADSDFADNAYAPWYGLAFD